MTGRHPRIRTLLVSAFAVLAAVVAALLVAPAAAHAQSVPVTVTATPTTGLNDGDVVRVHAEVPTGTVLYEIRARVCRPGVMVTNGWDFAASGNVCPVVALSPSSEADAYQALGGGARSGDLDVHVGVGSVRWQDLDGQPAAMSCGRDLPCQLVVQLQVTEDVIFWSTPLSFASSEQRRSPTPPPTRPDEGHGPVPGVLAGEGPKVPTPTTEPIALTVGRPEPSAPSSAPVEPAVATTTEAPPPPTSVVPRPGTVPASIELAAGPASASDGGGTSSGTSWIVPAALVAIVLAVVVAFIVRRARRV